jgi:hypothetical protein
MSEGYRGITTSPESHGIPWPFCLFICLGVLGLGTTAAAWGSASSVLSREVAPVAALAAVAVAVETTTATLRAAASAAKVVAVGVGLGAALLNDDLLSVDTVGAGAESGLETLSGLVLDKGAVL